MGIEDPDWISAVAARGLIVIGRDKHIRTRPAEVLHLHDAGLRAFYLGGKQDSTTWGWLTWLVRRWDDIEEVIRDRGLGPWFYVVNAGNVVERPIRHGVGQ